MVNCSRMKGICFHLVALGFLLAFTGCGSETPPSPESSPGAAVSPQRNPSSSNTPLPDTTAYSGTNSSGSSSGSVGSGSSSSSFSQDRQSRGEGRQTKGGSEDKRDKEPPALSPSDWRKQNFKPRPFSQFKELRGYTEVRSMSPQPPTRTTVESGKRLYSQSCIACHNLDGSPVRRDPALLKYNMADLSEAGQYQYGSSPKSVYRSIRYGVPSPPMGFTGSIYSRTEVWDMVNYIESLQKR
jgi:cytochrome c2